MTQKMKNDRWIKEALYAQCLSFIEERYLKIQHQIDDIQESLSSETKSSAGDKHETGRAMLQLEREKAGQQLAEVEKLKASLIKIDLAISSDIIGLGSVVFTSTAHYFIAISAGQLQVGTQSFFAISPNTPIGLLLLGKRTGDVVVFRDLKFVIEAFG